MFEFHQVLLIALAAFMLGGLFASLVALLVGKLEDACRHQEEDLERCAMIPRLTELTWKDFDRSVSNKKKSLPR